MVNQERFKELFSYDPMTGVFTSRTRRGQGGRYPAGMVMDGKEPNGYVVFRIGRETYKAHRLAFLYMTGVMPDEVDHKNGIRSDNHWDNLREATRAQQTMNRAISKSNSSGVSGVTWNEAQQKWACRIGKGRKRLWLGYHESVESAVAARRTAEAALFGEFSRVASC